MSINHGPALAGPYDKQGLAMQGDLIRFHVNPPNCWVRPSAEAMGVIDVAETTTYHWAPLRAGTGYAGVWVHDSLLPGARDAHAAREAALGFLLGRYMERRR